MTMRFSRLIWALLLVAPIVLFGSMVVIFKQQIVRDVPIAWVDLDRSAESRSILRQLDASPALQTIEYPSEQSARDGLTRGEVFALVVVPNGFSADIKRRASPTVRAVVNGQLVLVAKVVRAALSSVLIRDQSASRAIETLAYTGDIQSAVFSAAPVRAQLTPLFNRAGNYGQFLLPAILLAIWQILIVVSTVVHLTSRPSDDPRSEHGWISRAPSFSAVLRRSAELTGWFLLQGLLAFALLYWGLGFPFFGSITALSVSAVLFVLACQGLAITVCLIDGEATKAVSFAGALTAPSFAFLGVTFPTSDMPTLAAYWRELLPAAHGSELFISVANYGGWPARLNQSVTALIIIALSAAIVYWLLRGRKA